MKYDIYLDMADAFHVNLSQEKTVLLEIHIGNISRSLHGSMFIPLLLCFRLTLVSSNFWSIEENHLHSYIISYTPRRGWTEGKSASNQFVMVPTKQIPYQMHSDILFLDSRSSFLEFPT